jgi:hypothetical protein
VSNNYDCAARVLTLYKNSRNESVRASVDSLLAAISTTKDINIGMVKSMELLNKAEKPDDIDLVAIAEMLANVKSMQKEVANPIAFTITPTQRATLLTEVQELAKKNGQFTSVDACADILRGTLAKQLPTFVK